MAVVGTAQRPVVLEQVVEVKLAQQRGGNGHHWSHLLPQAQLSLKKAGRVRTKRVSGGGGKGKTDLYSRGKVLEGLAMQRMLKPDQQSELPQRAHTCCPSLFLFYFIFRLLLFR